MSKIRLCSTVAIAILLINCSDEPEITEPEATRQRIDPIIKGNEEKEATHEPWLPTIFGSTFLRPTYHNPGIVEIHSKDKNSLQWEFTCTGVFMSPTVLVTALHCVCNHQPYGPVIGLCDDKPFYWKPNYKDYRIVQGTVPMSEVVSPSSLVVNPSYVSKVTKFRRPSASAQLRHDIVLLDVEKRFPIDVRRAFYGEPDTTLYGKSIKCFGAGRFAEIWNPEVDKIQGTGQGQMRSALIPVINPTTAPLTFVTPITIDPNWKHPFPELIYLKTNALGQAIAKGDSGGPCFQDVNGEPRVVGITSISSAESEYWKTGQPSGANANVTKANAAQTEAYVVGEWLMSQIHESPLMFDGPIATSIAIQNPLNVKIGDVTGSTSDDVFFIETSPVERLAVLPSNNDGTFGAPVYSNFSVGSGWDASAWLADENPEDSKIDYVYLGDYALYTRLSQNDGTFGSLNVSSFDPNGPGGGDLWENVQWNRLAFIDGDSCADYVYNGAASLFVRIADCQGGFGPVIETPNDFGFDPQSATSWYAFADVDGDECEDYVYVDPAQIVVRLSDCADSFGAPLISDFDTFPSDYSQPFAWYTGVSFADIDGDGILDFVHPGPHDIWVRLGIGDGTFGPIVRTSIEWGNLWNQGYGMADLNNDGLTDFVYPRTSGVWVKGASHYVDGGFGSMYVDTDIEYPPLIDSYNAFWLSDVGFDDKPEIVFVNNVGLTVHRFNSFIKGQPAAQSLSPAPSVPSRNALSKRRRIIRTSAR